ncbi:THUMP domain-containing protein 2 isoform X2 [Polypterus senegalus]|uniref:THUMP domain-containing protein 2 isoform X2 n=1 Tax=Polypterus senegalus TaxID=55291 RepID=UPI001962F593|nr:THUMP domain-containing protein 2 isoform X2 [Polypterus senegalus]
MAGKSPFAVPSVCLPTMTPRRQVEYGTGKVFFSANVNPEKLSQLKAAERLFLLIKKESPMKVPWNTGKARHFIQKKIIGEDRTLWTDTILLWHKCQNLLQSVQRCVKRKREEDPREECATKRVNLEPSQSLMFPVSCRNWSKTPEVEQQDGEDELHKACGDSNSSVNGQQMSPLFRVSCRCSGRIARMFNAQELGRMIGTAVAKHFGWKTELRDPEFEINVHLSDVYWLVGIPVFRLPLAQRSYIKTTGLRPTIAWTMAFLADIKAGSVLLDPMCGVGTILLEAAEERQDSVFIGTDISESQLKVAHQNVESAGLNGKINLIRGSATEIPLQPASVDAIVCDLPFGRKFKCKTDIRMLLPTILKEMERVLRVGGNLVLLLSPPLSVHIQKHFGSDRMVGSGITSPVTADSSSSVDTNTQAGSADGKLLQQEIPRRRNEVAHGEATRAHAEHTVAGGSSPSPALPLADFPSLQLNAIYRVSLGLTDGLIHRYKKVLLT